MFKSLAQKAMEPFQFSPEKAAADLKGRQLASGRARRSLEQRTAELAEAQSRLEQARLAVGEAIDSGVDFGDATRAEAQAENAVRQLENVLAVVKQKLNAAEIDLQHAEGLAAAEQEESAIAHLKHTACPKFDTLCVELERLIEYELVPGMETARVAVGVGVPASWIVDMNLAIEMLLMRAARAAVPKGRAFVTLLNGRTLTSSCPSPETVRARRKINEGRAS